MTLSREGGSQLYLISRNGGAPRRLTTSQSIDTEATFAPDGRQIYFVSDRGGGPQIYRIGVDGGAVERVSFSGSYNISPSLSPDGRTLAYISRQGNAFRLFTLDLAGGGPAQAVHRHRRRRASELRAERPAHHLCTRIDGRDVLMTTTLDGKIKARLPSASADLRQPVWGPYGR